jgi:type I restriction enzyme M protein
MITVLETTERESVLKREIKEEQAELHVRTKELIQQMNYNDAIAVLSEKWISPIVDGIYR